MGNLGLQLHPGMDLSRISRSQLLRLIDQTFVVFFHNRWMMLITVEADGARKDLR